MNGTIYSHRWHPPSDVTPQARGIYLLHGIGEHAGRYERLARLLTSLGYEVASHDHPGHGKSTGKRGVILSDDALVDAAIKQFQAFEKETGALPILLGHSLGGLVATSMVLDKQVKVAGLILSAPAFVPFLNFKNVLKVKLLELLAPRFTQELPYNAGVLTHDKLEQEKALADPLMHRYKSAGIVGWIVRTGSRAIKSASALSTPTLILVPGGDVITDSSKTQIFIDKAPVDKLTARYYDDYMHEVLNETPERRERVFADIEQWLDQLSA